MRKALLLVAALYSQTALGQDCLKISEPIQGLGGDGNTISDGDYLIV